MKICFQTGKKKREKKKKEKKDTAGKVLETTINFADVLAVTD